MHTAGRLKAINVTFVLVAVFQILQLLVTPGSPNTASYIAIAAAMLLSALLLFLLSCCCCSWTWWSRTCRP